MIRLLLFLGAVLSLLSPSPSEANPACNSTVTSNIQLTGDLDCSGALGDPLIVEADGITVRLNGWTLTCPPGFVNSAGELDVEGIRVTNRSGVRILGPGKITGCGRGVTFQGGSDNLVRGLFLSRNLTGVVFQGGANHTAVRNVLVANQGNAIELSEVLNAHIIENWMAANGGDAHPVRGHGLTNDNASSAVIRGNRILGNVRGGIAEVGASALSSQIAENIVLGNGGLDLNLRGTDDIVQENICETSSPSGLCPHPLPRFPSR